MAEKDTKKGCPEIMESEYPELEGTYTGHQAQLNECPTPNEAPRGRKRGQHQAGVRWSSESGLCPGRGWRRSPVRKLFAILQPCLGHESLCIHSLEWRRENGIIAKITPQSLKQWLEPKRQHSLTWITPANLEKARELL